MITLNIEHPITDFDTWQRAFAGFAAQRTAAGVRAQAVHRPLDDANYVIIDLDFDDETAAAAFLEILRTRIWGIPANSPALVGAPRTRLLRRE